MPSHPGGLSIGCSDPLYCGSSTGYKELLRCNVKKGFVDNQVSFWTVPQYSSQSDGQTGDQYIYMMIFFSWLQSVFYWNYDFAKWIWGDGGNWDHLECIIVTWYKCTRGQFALGGMWTKQTKFIIMVQLPPVSSCIIGCCHFTMS